MRRRHALIQHDLSDHGRPAQQHDVAVHREGPHPAAAMTFHAVIQNDGGDLRAVVGHRVRRWEIQSTAARC